MLANSRITAQLQRRTKDLFFGDAALLLIDVDTGTVDDRNLPVVTTSEVPIECSYHELSEAEQWRKYGDVGIIAAEIRFLAPKPTKGNRVKIMSHNGGEPLPATEMKIDFIEDRGPFGFKCGLKAVTV